MKDIINIAIVMENDFVRKGLENIIHTNESFKVCSSAANTSYVADVARVIKPDIFIIDSKFDVAEAIDNIKESNEDVKIMLFNKPTSADTTVTVLKKGVMGVISSNVKEITLIDALHTVADGGMYLSPDTSKILLDKVVELTEEIEKPIEETLNLAKVLTKRERDVLQLIVDGKNNEEIGDMLYISHKTVKNHVSNILNKTKTDNRTAAAVKAIRNNWVIL